MGRKLATQIHNNDGNHREIQLLLFSIEFNHGFLESKTLLEFLGIIVVAEPD